MQHKYLEKFKNKLEEQQKQIEEDLGAIAEKDEHVKDNWESKYPQFSDHTDPEGSTPDEASDEVEEYITRLPLEQALEVKLKETRAALERIKKGAYGKCENCRGDIPLKRLEALPEATLCLDCTDKK